MPASQQHIHSNTPMGANLVDDGASFRVWAPAAEAVYVITDELAIARTPGWLPAEQDLLVRNPDETWTGFVTGVQDGSPYRLFVIGAGGQGFKRDPYARELGTIPPYPDCDCVVRAAQNYPWHDLDYRPPAFNEFILYQFHIGVYYAVDAAGQDLRPVRYARFLDLLQRIDYLRELGINAIQPLPIQEFPTQFSLGYNGYDYFSPEMDYYVDDDTELQAYLCIANCLLAVHGKTPLFLHDLRAGPNQLKAVIDICHLNGIAVLLDAVYNHAGGGFDDQSLYFLDRRVFHSNNDSLYFTDQGWAGGLIFAYWNPAVRQFLIDNASFLLTEYHIDGFRYDEVSVIDDHGGWHFFQALTNTVRSIKPEAIQIAEYWNNSRYLSVTAPPTGLGGDATLADDLRESLRAALRQASHGQAATINLDAVRESLYPPAGFNAAWRAVQCLENHDIVYSGREPRIPALADANDPRSWYARSRTRVASALLLTAPGIPHLFMGQEFLEDKNWSDNPDFAAESLLWWEGLLTQHAMRDQLACVRDLIALRRRSPALCSENLNVHHVHNDNRVIAMHRWQNNGSEDLVIVATLSETTFWEYQLGFPRAGYWREVFNSDYYDHLPNPQTAGNGGGIHAGAGAVHGLAYSASIVLPANAVLVFRYAG